MDFDLPHGFKRWASIAEVAAAAYTIGEEWRGQQAFQQQLLANGRERQVGGYCALCQCETRFTLEGPEDAEPNWRETVHCERCGLINRWRAGAHLYAMLRPLAPAGNTYITEQTGALFDWMLQRYPGLIGSEYLGPDLVPGSTHDWHGLPVRHEDITALSMADASLSALLSFDVLEHVPDYHAALREFARCLAPGGLLLLSAPFGFQSEKTLVRAKFGADGVIEHLLPPIYHGDPLSADGVLCWQEFGWDLVEHLVEIGFRQSEVVTCWAPQFGYLGGLQPFIVAWR